MVRSFLVDYSNCNFRIPVCAITQDGATTSNNPIMVTVKEIDFIRFMLIGLTLEAIPKSGFLIMILPVFLWL